MTGIKDMMRGDARLAILKALAADKGYSLNHRILRRVVDSLAAITLDDDEIKAHLGWLEDRGAVSLDHAPPFTIARLTDYGLDLSAGHTRLDGVSRPPPSGM